MSSAPVRPLSQRLKVLSVFYRSQMGRGARIKCIKCPPIELYERIKGFAKLCHKAVNHCHTRLKFLRRWPQEEKRPQGCCHGEYNFICQVSINTLDNEDKKKKMEKTDRDWNHDTRHDKLPQLLVTWGLPPGMSLQLNTSYTSAPLIIRFSTSPPELWCKKKKKKVLKAAITLPESKTEVHWTEQNLISGSPHPVRDTMQASLQEAMFSVIHRRRGDTMSACWRDHKCFRPVCMCMKQFVSLYNQMTPHSPQTWPLSIKGGLWFIITWVLFLKF